MAKSPGTSVVSIADIKKQMSTIAANISSNIAPPSGDSIIITQDKHFKLPNGQKSPGPLSVIIVDFISINAYYPGAYDPKKISPPVCFALGTSPTTLVPSAKSPEVQSTSCAACPNNEFGSSGDGKACKNGRRLAVLPPDADDSTPFAILNVSPSAIKAFDSYVSSIAGQFNVPPFGVVTEVTFDPGVTYASLRFGNPKPCNDKQLTMAFARKEDARKRLMVEPDVSKYVAPTGRKAAGGRK